MQFIRSWFKLHKMNSSQRTLPKVLHSYHLRYLLALITIAALSVVSQIVVQRFLYLQEMDSSIINLSGRQRMLSQKISKSILSNAFIDKNKKIDEIEAAIKEWQASHMHIFQGNHLWFDAFKNNKELELCVRRLQPVYNELQNLYVSWLKRYKKSYSPDELRLILRVDELYLKLMDDTVNQMEFYAEKKLIRIQLTELCMLALTLIILILEGVLIFKPLMLLLRRSMINITTRRDFANHKNRIRLIGQMTSQFIHELLNPLSSCQINAELIREDLSELKKIGDSSHLELLKQSDEKLDDILQGLDLIKSLSEGLRHFGKSHQNPKKMVDLKALIQTSARFSCLSQRKNVQVQVKSENSLYYFGCEIELLQIFINILNNALDATSQVATPEVLVILKEHEKDIICLFKDNGHGIPSRKLEKVCDPFYTTKEGTDSMGLGLYIVKKLLDKEGIHFYISSTSKGSEVKLIFPYTRS